MTPGATRVSPRKDDSKKKLQQFMHNARKVRSLHKVKIPICK